MTKPPDLDKLAQQYLDLWQTQLAGMAADREVADLMARTLELMNAGAAGFANAAQQAMTQTGMATTKDSGSPDDGRPDATGSSSTATASGGAGAGPAPAAAPSGAANHDLDDLAGRVAALEKRMAELEAGTGGSRKRAPAKPRKRKS